MVLPLSEVGFKIVPKLLDKIFVYPTDTIYGIGCNAEKKNWSKDKKRKQKSFSIIVPSKKYILRNFVTTKKEMNRDILKEIELIIDGGRFPGKPSVLIKEGRVIER